LPLLPRERCAAQDGAGAVGEQHAQVDGAALGDAAEPMDVAVGVLARREPERAGEVATRREAVELALGCAQRRGGDQPDAARAS
jgi:hypothetical protein